MNMVSVLEDTYDYGFDQGYDKGYAKRDMMAIEDFSDTVIKLMNERGWTSEEAISILSVSDEQREIIRKRVAEQK